MNNPTLSTRFVELQALSYAGAGLTEIGDGPALDNARHIARVIQREAAAVQRQLEKAEAA